MTPGDLTALLERVVAWRDDPVLFVREAFDWQHGELSGETGPDTWQVDVLEAIGHALRSGQGLRESIRIAVASGHGIGKTALIAWIILWAMTTRPQLNGVVTANTATQLETKTWRELSLWHKRAIVAECFEWTATRFAQIDHRETWGVSAIPWTKERSEAFAGQHAENVLVLYDEGSGIDDVIYDVSEGAMTTPGAIWCVFGNPTRNTGRFRECFGRFKHRWMTRQVDSRTAKKANQFEIAKWIEDYGEDSDFVRVKVRGVFPRAGSSQFIDADIIEAARTRLLDSDVGAPMLLGVDVARFGDDQSVIRFRAGRDARTVPPLAYRGVDTMVLASHVVLWAQRVNAAAVFIDGNGVGGGVVDRCRQLLKRSGITVIEVQAGASARNDRDYHNKRAEMWGSMREWLAHGSIDDHHELTEEMGQVEFGFDSRERVLLEKKDDMKRRGLSSPDHADALALTFAEPVARRAANRGVAVEVAEIDYPVFG